MNLELALSIIATIAGLVVAIASLIKYFKSKQPKRDKLERFVVTKISSICYEWENKSFTKGYDNQHFVQIICKVGSLKYVNLTL